MRTLIHQATLINEGREYQASVLMENDVICDIFTDEIPEMTYDEVIEAGHVAHAGGH